MLVPGDYQLLVVGSNSQCNMQSLYHSRTVLYSTTRRRYVSIVHLTNMHRMLGIVQLMIQFLFYKCCGLAISWPASHFALDSKVLESINSSGTVYDYLLYCTIYHIVDIDMIIVYHSNSISIVRSGRYSKRQQQWVISSSSLTKSIMSLVVRCQKT